MKVARFVLKIVAVSLTVAAAVCAVIAYWDKLVEIFGCARKRLSLSSSACEYEDYEDFDDYEK